MKKGAIQAMEYKKVILFTANYPHGIGEIWIKDELPYLQKYCNEIEIIPLYDSDPLPQYVPVGNNV